MSGLEIAAKVTPVILLLLLGFFLKRTQFVSAATINEFKKLVVNLSVPGLLFLAFLNTDFQWKYLWIVILIFTVNVLMLLAGKGFQRLFHAENQYFLYMFSGFELGMLGFSLFGTVYGINNLSTMGILDLGHEIFVWFVLIPLLINLKEGPRSFAKIGLSFLTSPVIIGVLLGVILNLSGCKGFLTTNPLAQGFLETIRLLSQLTIPLILIIIGYQLNFQRSQFRLPVVTILLRTATLILLAFVIVRFVFEPWLKLPRIFNLALWVIFILPPPYVISLFSNNQPQDDAYINNTLSLGSLISIAAFIMLVIIFK